MSFVDLSKATIEQVQLFTKAAPSTSPPPAILLSSDVYNNISFDDIDGVRYIGDYPLIVDRDQPRPPRVVVVDTQSILRKEAIVETQTALQERLRTALADNRVYLALTPPTQAQNARQINDLTRQMNYLVRLVLFSDTLEDGVVDT